MANNADNEAPGTLNIRLDMAKVEELLANQPRAQLTMNVAGQEHLMAEVTRTQRPGVAAADTNVNVLC